MSALGAMRSLLLGLAALTCGACGTVDPGQDVQFAEVTYDQNFFYCKVEPVLFSQGCGPGQPSNDPPGGCHYNVTPFRLQDHPPIPCSGNVPTSSSIPSEAQANYQAAEREMSQDPNSAPLLIRPTQAAAHPRKIFASDSTQANVIRQWATKYTSQ